jgi:hypothetical protein
MIKNLFQSLKIRAYLPLIATILATVGNNADAITNGKWNAILSCGPREDVTPTRPAFKFDLNELVIGKQQFKLERTYKEPKNSVSETWSGQVNDGNFVVLAKSQRDNGNIWSYQFKAPDSKADSLHIQGVMLDDTGKQIRSCNLDLALVEAEPAQVKSAFAGPVKQPIQAKQSATNEPIMPPEPAISRPTKVTQSTAEENIPKIIKEDAVPAVNSQETTSLVNAAPIQKSTNSPSLNFNDLIHNTYFLIALAVAFLILAFFILRAFLRFLKRKTIQAANAARQKANEISEKINSEANALKNAVTGNINDLKDRAKEKAHELSDVAQNKAAELTNVAKAQAEKLNEEFNKEGGHKDKLKVASAQGFSFAKGIAQDLKEEALKINEIRKDTLNANDGTVAKRELASIFWGKLSIKQKGLLVGSIVLIFYIIGSMTGGNTGDPSIGVGDVDCREFIRLKHECATAANYRQCLTLKTGNPEYWGNIEACNEDGTAISPKYKYR